MVRHIYSVTPLFLSCQYAATTTTVATTTTATNNNGLYFYRNSMPGNSQHHTKAALSTVSLYTIRERMCNRMHVSTKDDHLIKQKVKVLHTPFCFLLNACRSFWPVIYWCRTHTVIQQSLIIHRITSNVEQDRIHTSYITSKIKYSNNIDKNVIPSSQNQKQCIFKSSYLLTLLLLFWSGQRCHCLSCVCFVFLDKFTQFIHHELEYDVAET